VAQEKKEAAEAEAEALRVAQEKEAAEAEALRLEQEAADAEAEADAEALHLEQERQEQEKAAEMAQAEALLNASREQRLNQQANIIKRTLRRNVDDARSVRFEAAAVLETFLRQHLNNAKLQKFADAARVIKEQRQEEEAQAAAAAAEAARAEAAAAEAARAEAAAAEAARAEAAAAEAARAEAAAADAAAAEAAKAAAPKAPPSKPLSISTESPVAAGHPPQPLFSAPILAKGGKLIQRVWGSAVPEASYQFKTIHDVCACVQTLLSRDTLAAVPHAPDIEICKTVRKLLDFWESEYEKSSDFTTQADAKKSWVRHREGLMFERLVASFPGMPVPPREVEDEAEWLSSFSPAWSALLQFCTEMRDAPASVKADLFMKIWIRRCHFRDFAAFGDLQFLKLLAGNTHDGDAVVAALMSWRLAFSTNSGEAIAQALHEIFSGLVGLDLAPPALASAELPVLKFYLGEGRTVAPVGAAAPAREAVRALLASQEEIYMFMRHLVAPSDVVNTPLLRKIAYVDPLHSREDEFVAHSLCGRHLVSETPAFQIVDLSLRRHVDLAASVLFNCLDQNTNSDLPLMHLTGIDDAASAVPAILRTSSYAEHALWTALNQQLQLPPPEALAFSAGVDGPPSVAWSAEELATSLHPFRATFAEIERLLASRLMPV